MSLFIQIVNFSKKMYLLRKLYSFHNKKLLLRQYSDIPRKFTTFDEVITRRRAESLRSLVVQVNSESSFAELYTYCSKYADVNGIHHYKNSTEEHFMLIEFKTEEDVKEILHNCGSHRKDLHIMALQSPFMWFRAVSEKKEKLLPATKSLVIKDGTQVTSEDTLFDELMSCGTVSDQIQILYNRTVLNDLGIRLRFMVARQLECILSSLYANVVVKPFGSSVNGFGRMGCDLDLVLTNELTPEMSQTSNRLVFHEKKCESGRSQWQRHMELLGEVIELRVPGAARVQRILHARVPIVKYTHEFAELAVDLCYIQMSGVYMSELLWLYGSLDPRVRPLAFAVRRWAQSVGLTNVHPGRWITNFPLTLMVLFFLQQNKEGAILPSLRTLTQKAGKEDVRTAEDGVNCTFLRDLDKLPEDSYGQNSANLETLLLQFFEFYAQFNFQDKAISINEGVPIRKPNSLPLYIVNPLDQALNVSRNVSFEECERLKVEVKNAAWQLEAGLEGGKTEDWGLLGITEKKAMRGLKKLLRVGNSHRLISVKDLFKDDEEDTSSANLKSKLERPTKKDDKDIEDSVKEMKVSMEKNEVKLDTRMKFKNRQVANQVQRIRRNKIL